MALLDFKDVSGELDNGRNFANVVNTGWHQDAVYEQFSDAEYQRRYQAVYDKMDRLGIDVLIAGGGPNHWTFGGGMLWLTGHWEWHAIACYLVVPRNGEPTLVYSMGGSHIESTRLESYVKDVRPSRSGRFAEVMAEVIKEKGLERGRIGHPPIDPRHLDYMPINQYNALREGLPDAEIVLLDEFFHELLTVKSEEELECVRKAGQLCVAAFDAMVQRARPGVTEQELRGAAGAAILEGGGDIDFLIIGATSTRDPHMVFGSPRPSLRKLQPGDIILNELAAGYRGYTAQIGMPIFVGEPEPSAREFFEQIAKPGFERMAELLKPGHTLSEIQQAGRFFRDNGYQSRPIHLHGIDLVSSEPHVYVHDVHDEEIRPGQVLMLEPNPIRADGNLGIFYGHTFIITEDGNEMVTRRDLDMILV